MAPATAFGSLVSKHDESAGVLHVVWNDGLSFDLLLGDIEPEELIVLSGSS